MFHLSHASGGAFFSQYSKKMIFSLVCALYSYLIPEMSISHFSSFACNHCKGYNKIHNFLQSSIMFLISIPYYPSHSCHQSSSYYRFSIVITYLSNSINIMGTNYTTNYTINYSNGQIYY